jgi:hypothetical protein
MDVVCGAVYCSCPRSTSRMVRGRKRLGVVVMVVLGEYCDC